MKLNNFKNKIVQIDILKNPILFLLFITSLFLILSHDKQHHWDEVFYLYASTFQEPSNWSNFSIAKYGHLLLLRWLINFVGTGLKGLFFADLIYALMILCFIFISFILLKELLDNRNEAIYATIILMFLPLTLYLSFKTLSEVPALLLGSLCILSFFYGLKEDNRYKALVFILVSSILLFFASMCRLDVSIMFFSFFLALLAIHRNKFKLKKILSSFAIICIIFSILIFTLVVFLDINLFAYAFEANIFSHGTIFGNLYRASLAGCLFYPFIILSLFNYKEKQFKFAFIWFISANIPIWVLIDFIDVRHLYCSLIPLSILIYIGFKELFGIVEKLNVNKNAIKVGFISLFSLILIVNLFFMGSIAIEVNEDAYIHLFEKIDNTYTNKIILIPYAFSDYRFLKFAFPNEQIFLVQNIQNTEEEKKVMEEIYEDEYIGDLESLRIFSNTTILYVSWERQKDYIFKKGRRTDVYNFSWITKTPQLSLEKIIEEKYKVYNIEGQYNVYIVKLKQDLL